jgi:hypothetical protein
MAEEAIPSAADPLQSRVPSTRLPSLAELYAAQQLGQSLQANSYTLPELYALEQTGTPLDLAPSPDASSPQQSPPPQSQQLPILVDQSGAPLQPEPLAPDERLGGAARAAAHGAIGGGSDFAEAAARNSLGWEPKSTRARRAVDEALRTSRVGKVPSISAATYDDHLTDVGAESQRYTDTYPVEAAGLGLAGASATGLLGRLLAGERLVGEAAARAAPQLAAPVVRRLGSEIAEQAAPSVAATKAESVATPIRSEAGPSGTANAVSEAEATPQAIPRPPAEPDGRYYSVLHSTKLEPKREGTGRRGHNR